MEYDSIIRDQLKSGIVEPVVENAVNPPEAHVPVNLNQSVHYLPPPWCHKARQVNDKTSNSV